MSEEKEVPQVDLGKPGYIMVMNANLGNERQLSITGNFPVDVSLEKINAELDKWGKAIDRKQAQASVPAIEKKVINLKDMIRNLKQQKLDTDARVAKKYGDQRIPDPEQQNQHNLTVDIMAKEDMLKYEEQLLERTKGEAL